MNCNRCNVPVDEELILHFDTLPMMTGYNYIPPCARCVCCKKPVCEKCMRGLGMFTFVCTEECLAIIVARHPGMTHWARLLEPKKTDIDAQITNDKITESST